MKQIRIAVVNSHPIQYFAPLYAYLNRDKGIELTALYCSDVGLRGSVDPSFGAALKWDIDLLSGYRSVFLGDRASKRVPAGFWSLIVPEIWTEIRSGLYDVVWLHGYSYFAFLLAFLAAKSKGLPVLVRGETHLGLRRSALNRKIHNLFFSYAFKAADAFLAIGSSNRQYYLALGVPSEKIFAVPYTVDNDRFIAAASLSEEERADIRGRFGLPPNMPVILYAAKFMRRKHPDDLIRAAALLRDRGFEFSILMVGSGEMDLELRALAREVKLTDVVFGGFINQLDLPRVSAACDVFVLTSENEPWGLIVNEVMCAGLPVIISDEMGCAPDLVDEGVNGYRIRAVDPQALADALERVLRDPARRTQMGRRSLAKIRNWSYEQCRVGLYEALSAVVPHLLPGRPVEVAQ